MFSKDVDKLLDDAGNTKSQGVSKLNAASTLTEGAAADDLPSVWWQAAILGSLALGLIGGIRAGFRVAAGSIEPLAALPIILGSFAVGAVLGLIFWAFQHLKSRFR